MTYNERRTVKNLEGQERRSVIREGKTDRQEPRREGTMEGTRRNT